MKLSKYQSTGNDFILAVGPIENIGQIAQKVCDRHFGIGADGLMVAYPSTKADVQMVYYNSDGSIAPMCGNGLRAFTHFVFHQGLVSKRSFEVETLAGNMNVQIEDEHNVSISLNAPIFKLTKPHVLKDVNDLNPVQLKLNNEIVSLHVLMLGTLHGIVIVNDLTHIDVNTLGSLICHHSFFPEFINVNFVEVLNNQHIKVKTFERGAGPTLSCGTGVASSAVVTQHLGLTLSKVQVTVPGGSLEVEVSESIILRGPTQLIAHIDYLGDIK
jgi:diaminopimelate epimerase